MGIGLDESELGDSFTTVLSKTLRIEVDTTPLVLTGTHQTVFSYTGSGKLTGYELAFDKIGSSTKLTIDGTEVIYDIVSADLDAVSSNKIVNGIPLVYDSALHVLVFSSIQPIEYETSVLIEALKIGGAPVSLSGYLVSLTKDT